MSKGLTIFENEEFGTIRTLEVDNEPWFVGKDVAEALGYNNASKAVSSHVDSEDKQFVMVDIADSQNGNVPIGKSKTAIINESGLYSLIISSKLPSAKKFKRWVTSEVLPQIRKTGGYIPVKEEESDMDILAKALKIADRTIKEKDSIISTQKERILDLEKTEEKYNVLTSPFAHFSMNDVAHMIGIGEYKLFQHLRNLNVLFKNEWGDNIPYENPTNHKKFCVVPVIDCCNRGRMKTMVTFDGIDYIVSLLQKHDMLDKSFQLA